MVGEKLSHYEITAELGSGGMGDVYRARDVELKREVALKVLPPRLAGSQERLDRFRREAEALAALDHPSIVTIYSIEEDGGVYFITMQLVEGKPLSESIPRDGMPLEQIFDIGIDLADALACAHEKGITHRDLKPSNVMITPGGGVKILDFGLAKLHYDSDPTAAPSDATTEYLTDHGTRLGTLPYMSPEQVRGDPVDHRADIFSLGAVLHEMALGSRPFQASSEADLTSAILRDAPDSVDAVRSELPHHLGRIVLHCLKKDPEQRLQSAKDLRNELQDLREELLSGTLAPAPTPNPIRRRAWQIATGVIGIAALAITLYFLRPPPEPPEPPTFLRIEPIRQFADNETPEHLRSGIPWLLARRLGGLPDSVIVTGAEGPHPHLLAQVDVRRRATVLYLSYRLVESIRGESVGGEVLNGDWSEVIALLDRIAERVARRLGSHLGRGVNYRAPPPPTKVPEALDAFLAGLHLYRSPDEENLVAARQSFTEASTLDPRFSLAKAYEGLTLLREHSSGEDQTLAEALAVCREVAETDPDLEQAHFCRGEAHRLAGRPVEATNAYERAIRFGMRDPIVFQRARDAYSSLGRPESEESFWKRIIERQPRFWAGYAMLGRFYYDQGDHDRALAQYQHAIELAPTHIENYLGLFSVQYALGRFGEAIATLERAIELEPENHHLWGNLGAVYFLLRRFDQAIAAYEKTVELQSDDHRAQGYLGRANFWAPGRRDEARPHLHRAVELCREHLSEQPYDAEATILLAWWEAMLGRTEASREHLGRALEMRANDAHFLYLAGLIEIVLGDEQSALDYLQTAVTNGWETTELRTTIEVDALRGDPRFASLLRGS